ASTIASNLSQLEVVRVIDENPTDLKEYGLAMPRIEVAFKAAGDKGDRRLIIGDKSPTGSDLFARRNADKRVFLIPGYQESSRNSIVTVDAALADEIKKDVDQYRRKDVFEFRSFNLDRLDLTRNGQTVAFEKVKGKGDAAQDAWKRVSPTPGDVDKTKVESLV